MKTALRYAGRFGVWIVLCLAILRATETEDGRAFVALVGSTLSTVMIVRGLDRAMGDDSINRLPPS